MKERIYCPDIECDSCVNILNRVFKRLEGIKTYKVKDDYVDIEFDQKLISSKEIIKAIKAKGYRASLKEFTRKRIRDRAKEFVKDRKKYALEYRMLKNIGLTFLVLIILDAVLFFWKSSTEPSFFADYFWWVLYLTISIVVLGGAIWHFKAYRTRYTCMVGMMIGMTIGMQSGMMIGAILGATNGFFIGAFVGMILASIVGAYTGHCCGVMGMMEGMMAGLMGGTMGAMITVMMFTDHIFIFMPFYMLINIIILAGLSYMIFEEVVEDNENIIKRPMSFLQFLFICIIASVILKAIMLLAPASVFLR